MRVVVVCLVAVAVAVALLSVPPPAAAEDGWVWPVEGAVLTPYSNDNSRPYAGGMHRGIDIAAGVGTRVVAARAGMVTHTGVVGSSGLTVAVRSADSGHLTSYLHLSEVAVEKGDAVTAGARIGAVGTSGRRSVPEPHLHFGVRLADVPDRYVDPLSLLPGRPAPPAPTPTPVPAPVPLRTEPQVVPVRVPARARVPAAPRAAPAPRPARVRPRGTLQPGAATTPRPALATPPVPAAGRHARSPSPPRRVHAGPAPARSRASSAPSPAGAPHVAAAPAGAGHGRSLVMAGLGLIGLVLFGGLAWRALARANASVNAGAAAAGASIRDRARASLLRRLMSP